MRKGQVAVEYLMTYGWAILALLIVIAAIFASGILSPTYLISEECSFGNNMPCNFALFNENGETKMLMEIFNAYPYKIKIVSIQLQTEDGSQSFSGFTGNMEVRSGGSADYSATLSPPMLQEGSIKRFRGNITYVSCAPELGPECSTAEHVLSGRVVGRIIPQ